MIDNVIHKITQKVNANDSLTSIAERISTILNELGNIYSYVVYSKYKDKELVSFRIEYSVSQTDEYNTLTPDEVVTSIIDSIERESKGNFTKLVIAHGQPPIDIMVVAYEPFVKKLAKEQLLHWNNLEYEDLYQMCMYTMIKLHKANYHLNTALLKRSFNNEVLMHIRKNKNSPVVLSLDSSSYVNKDGEDIRIEDTVTDYSALYDMYEVEENDAKEKELEDKRSLVLDVISKRQYDQLIREYGNKITTNAGRHTVARIKQKLKNKGITPELFFRYHESNKGDI